MTFGGAEWDWDRISKVRARPPVRNEQGYNFISGFYMLGPKLRPASVPPKTEKVGHINRLYPVGGSNGGGGGRDLIENPRFLYWTRSMVDQNNRNERKNRTLLLILSMASVNVRNGVVRREVRGFA